MYYSRKIGGGRINGWKIWAHEIAYPIAVHGRHRYAEIRLIRKTVLGGFD